MTYVGCTGDLDKRLERHNSGQVKSSKYYRPFVLIHKEEFATLPEARKKESFYRQPVAVTETRTMGGRAKEFL